MTKLFVVPWYVAAVLLFGIAAIFGASLYANDRAARAERNLVACEARAQSALVASSQCDSLLASCMGNVHRIADALELSGVEF